MFATTQKCDIYIRVIDLLLPIFSRLTLTFTCTISVYVPHKHCAISFFRCTETFVLQLTCSTVPLIEFVFYIFIRYWIFQLFDISSPQPLLGVSVTWHIVNDHYTVRFSYSAFPALSKPYRPTRRFYYSAFQCYLGVHYIEPNPLFSTFISLNVCVVCT